MFDDYQKPRPPGQVSDAIGGGIRRFCGWYGESFRYAQERFHQEVAALESQRQEIQVLDERLNRNAPDIHDRVSVDTYNALVTRRNSLVDACEASARALQDKRAAWQKSQEHLASQAAVGEAKVEAAQRKAELLVQELQQWMGSEEEKACWPELNQRYARLHEQQVFGVADSRVAELLARLKKLRGTIGTHAIARHAKARSVVIVQASLCDREDGFFVVDTGATCVTISPTLVAVLGLSDRLGEERRFSLAGGIEVTSHELVLPKISVNGAEARDVEAAMPAEPVFGVDGVLGLSFLDRFEFRLEKSPDPRLILTRRRD
jgi:hypothetical protein